MITLGHRAVASPVGTGLAVGMVHGAGAPVPVALGCAALVVAASTWPDLADVRFKGRMHPGAALVRGSCHIGYRFHTKQDHIPMTVDEAPAHSLEWCLLAGVVVVLVSALIPPLAPWCWWWGGAVTLGALTHVAADWPTPSGVTGSAVVNAVIYRQVWRQHTTGWFETDSGGDKFLLVPVMFLVTGLMVLHIVGWLGPIARWMVGA